jgi:hypothetical protein
MGGVGDEAEAGGRWAQTSLQCRNDSHATCASITHFPLDSACDGCVLYKAAFIGTWQHEEIYATFHG